MINKELADLFPLKNTANSFYISFLFMNGNESF